MKSLCGDCTVCCTILGVSEIPKKSWTKCQHQARGCAIYDERPASCRMFACVWLQDQQREKHMPRSLRPDKSKVMLAASPNGKFLTAYSLFPAAWRRGEMRGIIERTSKKCPIAVTDGTRHYEVQDGLVREIEFGPTDETKLTRTFERYLTEEEPM